MGLLTDYIRQQHQKELQERDAKIAAYSHVLTDPNAPTEGREYAFDQIMGMGKMKGKQHEGLGGMFRKLLGLGAGAQQGQPQPMDEVPRPGGAAKGAAAEPQQQPQVAGPYSPAGPEMRARFQVPPVPGSQPDAGGGQPRPVRAPQLPPVPGTQAAGRPPVVTPQREVDESKYRNFEREETLKHQYSMEEKAAQAHARGDRPVGAPQNLLGPDGKPHKYQTFMATDGTTYQLDLGVAPSPQTAAPTLQQGVWLDAKGESVPVTWNPRANTYTRQDTGGAFIPTPGGSFQKALPKAAAETGFTGEAKNYQTALNILADPKSTPSQISAAKAEKKRFETIERGRGEKVGEVGEKKSDAALIAQSIIRGEQPPDLSRLYGQSGHVRAELAKAGFDLTRATQDWKAVERHIASLNSVGQLRLREATNFAKESLDLIDAPNPKDKQNDLIGKVNQSVGRSRFKILNKASLAAAKEGMLGQDATDAATLLDQQIRELQSELAVVYKGGNSPTDLGLKSAMDILHSDWSESTLRKAVDLTRKNLGIRLNSIRNSGVVSVGDANQYAPTDRTKVPPPPGSAAPKVKTWNPETGKFE